MAYQHFVYITNQNNDEDTFYVPHHIVTGANPEMIQQLFDQVLR